MLTFCLKGDKMNAVTFLALGNGAPDISSSIAAISSGNYELALGALLGTSPTATTLNATNSWRTEDSSIAGGTRSSEQAAQCGIVQPCPASAASSHPCFPRVPPECDMNACHQAGVTCACHHSAVTWTFPRLQAEACLWGRSWRAPSCWSTGGAKARGALLRDVAALGLAVCTITAFLSAGAMSYARGGVLLAEYVAFVLIVLGADLWHIFTR